MDGGVPPNIHSSDTVCHWHGCLSVPTCGMCPKVERPRLRFNVLQQICRNLPRSFIAVRPLFWSLYRIVCPGVRRLSDKQRRRAPLSDKVQVRLLLFYDGRQLRAARSSALGSARRSFLSRTPCSWMIWAGALSIWWLKGSNLSSKPMSHHWPPVKR